MAKLNSPTSIGVMNFNVTTVEFLKAQYIIDTIVGSYTFRNVHFTVVRLVMDQKGPIKVPEGPVKQILEPAQPTPVDPILFALYSHDPKSGLLVYRNVINLSNYLDAKIGDYKYWNPGIANNGLVNTTASGLEFVFVPNTETNGYVSISVALTAAGTITGTPVIISRTETSKDYKSYEEIWDETRRPGMDRYGNMISPLTTGWAYGSNLSIGGSPYSIKYLISEGEEARFPSSIVTYNLITNVTTLLVESVDVFLENMIPGMKNITYLDLVNHPKALLGFLTAYVDGFNKTYIINFNRKTVVLVNDNVDLDSDTGKFTLNSGNSSYNSEYACQQQNIGPHAALWLYRVSTNTFTIQYMNSSILSDRDEMKREKSISGINIAIFPITSNARLLINESGSVQLLSSIINLYRGSATSYIGNSTYGTVREQRDYMTGIEYVSYMSSFNVA